MLYLLTHRSPDELPQKRMKIDFRSCVQISPQFANWLEKILEPMFEDRFQSAAQALNALQNNSEIISSPDSSIQSVHKKPKGSRVKIQKTSKSLVVDIPPAGFRSQDLFLWIFNVLWNGFLLLVFISGGIQVLFSPVIFHVIVGVVMLGFLLWTSASKTRIQIDTNEFSVSWKCLLFSRKSQGKTADLDKISINETGITSNRNPVMNCALFEGIKKHQFGSLLVREEQEWLVAEISDFLGQLKSR